MDSLPDLTLTSEFRREYAVRIKANGKLVPVTRARATEFLMGVTEGPKLELVTRTVRLVVTDWARYDQPDSNAGQ